MCNTQSEQDSKDTDATDNCPRKVSNKNLAIANSVTYNGGLDPLVANDFNFI